MTSKAKLLMLNCCYTNIDTYNGILSSYCVKILKNIINIRETKAILDFIVQNYTRL